MNRIKPCPIAAAILLLFALTGVQICAASGSDENHLPPGYAGKPMTGTPQVIPGVIQAESYDVTDADAKEVTVGGPVTLKKTNVRPGADSAGLGRYGSGHVSISGQPEAPDQAYVGWTKSGQWMAYTVRVTEPGTYLFGGKFAAGGKGSKISVTFTPEITTGPVEIPTTAGYQPAVEVYHVWETLDKLKEITLPAGVYVMKVKIEKASGLNIDYFSFTKSGVK
jgi:hypothetical protein